MAITPVSTLVSKAKEQIETLLQEDAEAQVEAGTAQFVDCLLYTSPSPRDLRKSRMPSSA